MTLTSQHHVATGHICVRIALASAALTFLTALASHAQSTYDYRVLSTSKTSTLEKEMNEAAEAGFRFSSVMGGETAIGGKELVAITRKAK